MQTGVMAPSALHRALHSCPVHTCAHHPATPATLLLTLHIPPHNPIPPAYSHPGSCGLPPSPSHTSEYQHPFKLTHTLAQTISFSWKEGPLVWLSAGCPAPPTPHPAPLGNTQGSSCSTIRNPLTLTAQLYPYGLHKAGQPAHLSASFPGPQFLLSFRLEEKEREGAVADDSRDVAPHGSAFTGAQCSPHTSPVT